MSSFLPAALEQGKPKLLDHVRQFMPLRHYNRELRRLTPDGRVPVSFREDSCIAVID